MKVLRFPLAKITIWFVAGIVFAFCFKPSNLVVFGALALTALALAISYLHAKRQLIQTSYFGIVAYALAFWIGSATFIVHSGTFNKTSYFHRVNDSETEHEIELVLREKLKSTGHRDRYIAHVNQIDGKHCSGKILVNLDREYFSPIIPIGTQLKINVPIARHRPPKNPNQFDYGAYLTNKSIMAQVYAGATEIQVGAIPNKNIFYYSDKIRNTIIRNLEKSQLNANELAVIAALILGQQQDIDPETVRNYQLAGAVHILSVSGLHVGFILMFLNFILHYLPNNRRFSNLKLVIILVSLWGFAVLAGLSPSVIRSVTMFSFVAVGLHLKRKTNIFHTLLVSMLLILIFEPSFLFDVGFQLSYLALFFILWLQPLFLNLWRPENKIVHYFWQILTVSFAAQIGTFPLSVYYFHQFPGLFFVTNLAVIPLLSAIMALGIAAMIPALFGTVPLALIKVLEWSIVVLNQIIARIASLEQFIFENVAMNLALMFGWYLMIVAVVVWFEKPNFKRLSAALIAVVALQGIAIDTRRGIESESEWIVFNQWKSTLVAERIGRDIFVYGGLATNENKMLQTYATAHFSQIKKHRPLRNVAYFDQQKILIIDSLGICPKVQNPDVLLLHQSPKINLERMLQESKPKVIVADASNYKSYVKLWKATCLKYKIPFHATAEMGYFKL